MPALLELYGTITGTLTNDDDRTLLPEGTRISIKVTADSVDWYIDGYRDLERPESFPLPFTVQCDPCHIDADADYTANSYVYGPEGEFVYVNAVYTTMITNGRIVENIQTPMVLQPTVTGTIRFDGGQGLPAGASGFLRLRDVSQADAELLHGNVVQLNDETSFPLPFVLTYPPAAIDPARTYALDFEIRGNGGQSCRVLYASKAAPRVITESNPSNAIQMEVVPVAHIPSSNLATVTGTLVSPTLTEDIERLSYHGDGRGSSGSDWHVEIVDVSRNCTIAEETLESNPESLLPVSFSILYDPTDVDPNSTYGIRAYHQLYSYSCGLFCGYRAVYTNRSHFTPPWVLTQGHPKKDVEVPVRLFISIS